MHFRRGIIFLDVSFFQHQRGDVKSGLPKQEPVDTCVTREKHVCLCYRADCIMSTVPPPSTTQTEELGFDLAWKATGSTAQIGI